MSVSNEIDDLNGCYSSPSPALSSLLLADHSPNVLPLSSNSGPPNLRNITSSPFSTTTRSVSPWPDNSDAFYNRQRCVSEVPYLFNKEGSASSAMPVPYARDLGRQFGQRDPDEIYTPRGRVSGSLTRDLYPSHFLVSADSATRFDVNIVFFLNRTTLQTFQRLRQSQMLPMINLDRAVTSHTFNSTAHTPRLRLKQTPSGEHSITVI
jgi:hypothetical protein